MVSVLMEDMKTLVEEGARKDINAVTEHDIVDMSALDTLNHEHCSTSLNTWLRFKHPFSHRYEEGTPTQA